jgi:hypothetical protein
MQLLQKINDLKEKKIRLLKKARTSKSIARKALLRTSALTSHLQLKHYENFKKTSNSHLKVFLSTKGLNETKIPATLKNKYIKKIIKLSNNHKNLGTPGTRVNEVPGSFSTNEPSLKDIKKHLRKLKNVKPKAILYSYVVDTNNEIWFGHAFVLTQKNTLRSFKNIKQKASKHDKTDTNIVVNNTENIEVPDIIDANTVIDAATDTVLTSAPDTN